ncbi:MAG: sodium-dependent transporter [Alistipes sp.]
MSEQSRVTLGGKLSAVLVAAGSAVGLGNIWRFPYVAGDNGGGAFLIIYILCVILLGLPIMLAEFSVGRATRKNSVGAYRTLDRKWSFLGYNSILSALLILGFYFVVSGWTLEYMVHSLTGDLAQYTTAEEYKTFFDEFIQNPWRPVLYTCLFALLTHFVIAMGVQKGIERSAQILMPLLFLILIALSIHSLLMPGGMAGLEFFFLPDFSKVTTTTVLVALGQAFFSLSIGLGCMVTYASYFKPDTNLRHTALNVTILDTAVAILAGVVIFPAVFSVGIEPSAGPSLVFVTLPSIFNGMPWSMVWSTIFFLLLIVAALTSTISLHEVLTVYLHEEWHKSRNVAAWIATVTTATLASVASLSMGVLNGYKIFGLTLFDSLDFVTANILLPAGGMFTCLFVGWKLDQRLLKAQITNNGTLRFRIYGVFIFLLRYICPAVLALIFLDNLGFLRF